MRGPALCWETTCLALCLLATRLGSEGAVEESGDWSSPGDFRSLRGFENRQAPPANLTQAEPNPQLAEPEVANPPQAVANPSQTVANPPQTVPRPPQLPQGNTSYQGHLNHLGGCRRQLTFLASMALGAFITRVMKESPLTPLPMPPLPNSLHWNLVRVPAHLAGHVMQWVGKHPAGQTVILNQGVAGLARSEDPWTRLRVRKDLGTQLRSSPNLILSALERTLKPLKFIHHVIGMQNWLLRWCH